MATIKKIKDLLLETLFFKDMADKHVELLASCGMLAHFKAGEFLQKEGEEANSFFLIRKGDVAIESHLPGHVLTIAKAGPNSVVGYSWLFHPYRNNFDSRAVTNVKAIKLDGKCLRGKAEQDHELGYQFMKRFAQLMLQRLHAAQRQMLDIYGAPGKAV